VVDYFVKGKHGTDSPYSQVEFNAGVVWMEKRNKFVDLTLLIPGLGGLDLEEMATMLAEQVHRHNPQLSDAAFESAKLQLLTRDYNGEWAELERKIKVHEMWGGPVPSAILLPNEDGDAWDMMMTGKNGMPTRYKVSEKAVGDAIPLPHKGNAIKQGESWYAKPTPQQAAMNREQRRLTQARKRQLVRSA
jgi:hypothetical protein